MHKYLYHFKCHLATASHKKMLLRYNEVKTRQCQKISTETEQLSCKSFTESQVTENFSKVEKLSPGTFQLVKTGFAYKSKVHCKVCVQSLLLFPAHGINYSSYVANFWRLWVWKSRGLSLKLKLVSKETSV